jgi:N-[(2S)-2-amino-2-carboxyethyl]-L-glutamate dehydrogenase
VNVTDGLTVVSGDAIADALPGLRGAIIDVVRATYIMHSAGQANNPPAQFLRFADHPDARIGALPAAIDGEHPVAGIKWISSFPSNTTHGYQRASAVLILNDSSTGYPYACLEASRISAARTAASAAIAAALLSEDRRAAQSMLFVGAGVIARNILDFLIADSWDIGQVSVYDTSAGSASALARYASDAYGLQTVIATDLYSALPASDIAIFATTALTPHVMLAGPLPSSQIVLHVSLRDLAPELIRPAFNVVDDAAHCLTAGTSLHLAAQRWGPDGLIHASIGELLRDRPDMPDDRARVFSPFGLGILDIAVGQLFLEAAARSGCIHIIDHFHGNRQRW